MTHNLIIINGLGTSTLFFRGPVKARCVYFFIRVCRGPNWLPFQSYFALPPPSLPLCPSWTRVGVRWGQGAFSATNPSSFRRAAANQSERA